MPPPHGANPESPGRSPASNAIPIRTKTEIDAIESAARAVGCVLQRALEVIEPGMTTGRIDLEARAALREQGAESLFEGYRQGSSPAFPGVACTCIDDEVVHGVPGGRVLQSGDRIGIDVGLRLDGWCADMGTSVLVGEECTGADDLHRLLEDTRRVLAVGIAQIRPGAPWSDVASRMEREIGRLGRGLVTEYVGHGIGRSLHEPPKAPAYWTGFGGPNFTLEEGMVLALEPILTARPGPERPGQPAGRVPIRMLEDGWTVVTANGTIACHEERMVVVEAGGARVLCDLAGEEGSIPLATGVPEGTEAGTLPACAPARQGARGQAGAAS